MAFFSPQERNGRTAECFEPARVELRARLEARRAEIEREALARANAISDSTEVSDPAYAQGLRSTVSAALDYAFDVIERGEEGPVRLPRQLLVQARLAARRGVPLDTVLRRYVAGYTLLGDFLVREREASGSAVATARLLPSRAAVLDRLIAAVSAEYKRALDRNSGRSSAQWRAERVRRLLAGESLDTAEFAYHFDRFHLGLVAQGSGCEESLRELTQQVDCTALSVAPTDGMAWAWIGTRTRLDPGALDLFRGARDSALAIALGEPAEDLAGWRLTHLQAVAALKVAQRDPGSVVRYRDVAILASALTDDVLAASLHHLYIAPLRE